jgi:folate-dependent phosphoribosylglycinamide formyltransferase PurN
MSVVFLTGSHPRHAFMARAVAQSGKLAALVIEQREDHVPEPPADIPDTTRSLFIRHFAAREAAERAFFGADFEAGIADVIATGVEVLRLSRESLNDRMTWSLLERIKPELVLSYGIHKLTNETLSYAKRYCWNIHGGLSPWYRGVITHFWPSYMLEPQMTGMTVHETTEAIDGGDVIHQCLAPLVRGDGLHELACRAVESLGNEMPELLRRTFAGELLPPVAHSTTGRIWRSSDWRPAHLHQVYEHYQNRIVDKYLSGAFGGALPKLVRQF